MQGLFHAAHHAELKEPTHAFIHKLSCFLFSPDPPANVQPSDGSVRQGGRRESYVSPLVGSYLEAVALALANLPATETEGGKEILSSIVDDILASVDKTLPVEERADAGTMLDAFGIRLSALCFEEPWNRKLAGCTGLSVLTSKSEVDHKWIVERQLDFLRPLLFILKDMPNDPPRTVDFVVTTIKHIIRTCNTAPADGAPPTTASQRQKFIQVLIKELASTNAVVRDTVQACIGLLSELTGTSVHDLLSPVKDQLLKPIFDKPLRALPFAMQIGNIEAITYCLNLRPFIPEINEELIRLMHEVIALADADDQALIGRGAQHRHEVSLKSLRISCLKLLSAAMACTDFFAKQNQARSRFVPSLCSSTLEKATAEYPLPSCFSQSHRGLLQARLLADQGDHDCCARRSQARPRAPEQAA